MLAQIKYHYKLVQIPESLTENEILSLYAELKWIRAEERKLSLLEGKS